MAAMTDRQPTEAAIELGEHLTRLRDAAGNPSWRSIERTIVLSTDGRVTPSDQQIQNLHAGRCDPSKVRVDYLLALKRYYHCESADLGPVAAAEIAVVVELATDDQGFSRRA